MNNFNVYRVGFLDNLVTLQEVKPYGGWEMDFVRWMLCLMRNSGQVVRSQCAGVEP